MAKIDKHIIIVSSTTRGLSSMSEPSRHVIKNTLSQHFSRVEIQIVNDTQDLKKLISTSPDVVVLGMKYIYKPYSFGLLKRQKVWISRALEANGIKHTGSDYAAHKLELNKHLAKAKVSIAGIKTSKYLVAQQRRKLSVADTNLEFPLFIKPIAGGGGSGIDDGSIVHTIDQANAKIFSIRKDCNEDSLIEEYLPGREYSVAILKKMNEPGYHVMPIELVAPKNSKGNRVLSAKVKKNDAEQHFAVTDSTINAAISELALNAFYALGARDYGRIDIRMDANNVPHFLEANLIPSLINTYGNFPKACILNEGIHYKDMLLQIVQLAENREIVHTPGLSQALYPLQI